MEGKFCWLVEYFTTFAIVCVHAWKKKQIIVNILVKFLQKLHC